MLSVTVDTLVITCFNILFIGQILIVYLGKHFLSLVHFIMFQFYHISLLFAHCSFEDFGALIVDGPLISTATRFHPFFLSDYLEGDVRFRDLCCNQADNCALFTQRRLPVDCRFYSPPFFS